MKFARFGLALMTVVASSPAVASLPRQVIIADGREVFRLPPDPLYGDGCDGRRLLKQDPDFRDGLIARYLYQRSPSDPDNWPPKLSQPDDATMTGNLKAWGLTKPSFVRTDGINAYATESFVIRSHDDLTKRFAAFCAVPLHYGYYLSDIEFTSAKANEQRDNLIEASAQSGVEPVFVDRYQDIMPTGATVISFTVPAAYWTARDNLRLPSRGEAGVGAIFEYEGSYHGSDTDAIRQLTQNGYLVLFLDFNGRRKTIVIDTQPVTSTGEMNARAKPVMELEWGNQLYLKRIAYFPTQRAGIADLRLPSSVRDELRHQVASEIERYRDADMERAQEMPSE